MVKIFVHTGNELKYEADELINIQRREYIFDMEKGDDQQRLLTHLFIICTDDIYYGNLISHVKYVGHDSITTQRRPTIVVIPSSSYEEQQIINFVKDLLEEKAKLEATQIEAKRADKALQYLLEKPAAQIERPSNLPIPTVSETDKYANDMPMQVSERPRIKETKYVRKEKHHKKSENTTGPELVRPTSGEDASSETRVSELETEYRELKERRIKRMAHKDSEPIDLLEAKQESVEDRAKKKAG